MAVAQVGAMIAGRYRVERVLGQGGMGVVVQATHLQLQRPVAIKFIRTEVLGTPLIAQRFLREAQAAVRLSSEHVARVIDVGTLDTGAPYMVLEYLEGADLASFPRGDLSIGGIVDLMLQACEALAEAHALGIVHRDLKPANFFLTRRADGTPLLKLLDFGISKTSSGPGPLTASQSVMGTPAYMSPEQMRSSRDVDHRTDLWSLGVVLYELLQGAPPFGGDTFSSMVLKVVNDPLPRMTVRLPGELDAVVYRCLEKDPARRFQSTAELAEALARYAASVTQAAISVQRTRSITGNAAPRAVPAGDRAHQALPSTLSGSAGERTARKPAGRRWPWIAAIGVGSGVIVGVIATSGGGRATVRPQSAPLVAPQSAPQPAPQSAQPPAPQPPAPQAVPQATVAPQPTAPPAPPATPEAGPLPARAASESGAPRTPARQRSPAAQPAHSTTPSQKNSNPPSVLDERTGNHPAKPRAPAADSILERRR